MTSSKSPTAKKAKTSSSGVEGGGGGKGRPLIVAVVGYTGGVGTCLLAAMDKIGLAPYALVRSSTMKIMTSIDGESDVPVNFDELSKTLLDAAEERGGTPVIADVTASETVQDEYKNFLSLGISVVTANKGIFAGDESIYEQLLTASLAPPRAKLFHETTVGAGLPVLSTLQSLTESSHDIVKVKGVVSPEHWPTYLVQSRGEDEAIATTTAAAVPATVMATMTATTM